MILIIFNKKTNEKGIDKMVEFKTPQSYDSILQEIQQADWNKESGYYMIGYIDAMFLGKVINKQQLDELYSLVPLTKDDLGKIHF